MSTACASGASAIQLGVEAIRRGEAEAALCIGTDGSVNPECLDPFLAAVGALDRERSAGGGGQPFAKNRDGFVMAEGAAALVLENYESAVARAAPRSSACWRAAARWRLLPPHALEPRRQADHRLHAQRASTDAGLTPDDIDYINPHGTGTPENDKMESLGVSAVFGERAKSIPISSNKSMIGHTLSAAGAVETVFTLLTLEHQRLPPTINYHVPDPAIPLDVVPNTARDAKVRHALSNSFGFGGQNVSLVMSREPRVTHAGTQPPRRSQA